MKFAEFLFKEPLLLRKQWIANKKEHKIYKILKKKKIQGNDTGTEHRKKSNVP